MKGPGVTYRDGRVFEDRQEGIGSWEFWLSEVGKYVTRCVPQTSSKGRVLFKGASCSDEAQAQW